MTVAVVSVGQVAVEGELVGKDGEAREARAHGGAREKAVVVVGAWAWVAEAQEMEEVEEGGVEVVDEASDECDE